MPMNGELPNALEVLFSLEVLAVLGAGAQGLGVAPVGPAAVADG